MFKASMWHIAETINTIIRIPLLWLSFTAFYLALQLVFEKHQTAIYGSVLLTALDAFVGAYCYWRRSIFSLKEFGKGFANKAFAVLSLIIGALLLAVAVPDAVSTLILQGVVGAFAVKEFTSIAANLEKAGLAKLPLWIKKRLRDYDETGTPLATIPPDTANQEFKKA